MLGIYSTPFQRDSLLEQDYSSQYIYPEKALLTKEEWKEIKEFYLRNAPDTLVFETGNSIEKSNRFSIEIPPIKMSPPSTTYIDIDKTGDIIVGDAHSKALAILTNEMEVKKSARLIEGIVNIHEENDHYLILCMGTFSPTDNPSGALIELPKDQKSQVKILHDDLNRPVHMSCTDLDNDGHLDFIVSEFGKWRGKLSVLTQDQSGGLSKKIIHDQTGPIAAYAFDYNGDSYMDVISLFAQGNEGIYMHINKGNFEFETKRIIDLNPSMGSSQFKLVDINEDGHLDIIYTAGDNADFPPIHKPYHGIYTYLNDGTNKFYQLDFIHLPGAYGVEIADFDNDGDKDIAAISFFPNFNSPNPQSVILLQKEGDQYIKFKIDTQDLGRWIVMRSGDIDQDGDTDLLLGSLAFEVPGRPDLSNKWIESGIPFIQLRNNTIPN